MTAISTTIFHHKLLLIRVYYKLNLVSQRNPRIFRPLPEDTLHPIILQFCTECNDSGWEIDKKQVTKTQPPLKFHCEVSVL